MSYTIIADTLYTKGKDGILHQCVTNYEIPLVLIKKKKNHDNMVGGHFVGDVIARFFSQSGYSWPTLFFDYTT